MWRQGAGLGVEMMTSSIRPLLWWMSGSSSAASTGSWWSSSEKPPRKEGEPAVMTAWPLVERGASSRKRQVTHGRDMEASSTTTCTKRDARWSALPTVAEINSGP